MPAQGGPSEGRTTTANDIVRNPTLVGEVLSDDVITTHRLPPPNEDKRRAEKSEHAGRVSVVVRMDAEDLGALLFAGVIDRRWESVLNEAELGAVVLANIVEDAKDLKEHFDAGPEGDKANFSVKIHHHDFSDEQLERPEFLISPEYRDHMKKSYVEFRWAANVPPESPLEHGIPIRVINNLVQVMKETGYERHWTTAIARFHPEWNSDHDGNFIARLSEQQEDQLMSQSFSGFGREQIDVSDLQAALRRELGLGLRDLRRGLSAYQESHSHIRIRVALNESAQAIPGFVDHLAEELHRELRTYALDGSHHVEPSEGGKAHVVLEYSFNCVEGEEFEIERAAAHRAIFSVIGAHRRHLENADR